MTTTVRVKALLAAALLAACGGVEPGPRTDREPDAGESTATPALDVLGYVDIDEESTLVSLAVLSDEAEVSDATVRVGGRTIPFDPDHGAYVARLGANELPSQAIALEVSRGEETLARSLVVPGAFALDAPAVLPLRTDFQVAWSAASGAHRYRIALAPVGGVTLRAELSRDTLGWAFQGLGAAGPTTVEVTAESENRDDAGACTVDVRRTVRRTVNVVEIGMPEEPGPKTAVWGRIVLVEGRAEVELDVLVDGAFVDDAALSLAGHPIPFVPSAHGYSARLDEAELPAGALALEVTHAGGTHRRSLHLPGPLVVETPATVPVGTPFLVRWNEVAHATGFRAVVTLPEGPYSEAEISAGTRVYAVGGARETGLASLRMSAVSTQLDAGPESTIEVVRVENRTVEIVD